MKASFLCGAHYEGAEAHQHEGWPTPPTLFDAEIGQRTFDDFLAYAALADELGFDWVSVSEHHYTPLILTPSVAPLAGALTQIVRRAKIALLGPLAPVNNPLRTAEEIAMLDQLSHGRLIVLPLRGTPNEFNCYVPVDPQQTQGMTQEAALLIQKALSETQPFRWDGRYFQFPTIAVWPRPVQQPHPPMFFSGNSPASAVFAGANRFGLCMSFRPPPAVAETVALYRAEAARAGWEPAPDQIVYRSFIVVADTAEQAADLEANFVPAHVSRRIAANVNASRSTEAMPADWRDGVRDGGTATAAGGNGADGAERTPDSGPIGFGLGRLLFAGTPDVIVERIRAFHELTGVGVLDFVFSGGQTPPEAVRRSIELFGREVLPSIRAIGAPTAGPARQRA
jgi:alkanesulfonate monooxygenase SsuD/methylene tetrahydromethanopterin reductase-like flavin-dependent oxidoreductase (luciferase family)